MEIEKSIHGTMMVIGGAGVLITGKSGIGKSELALGLLDRGHQIISDDLVTLIRKDNVLIAQCPPTIKNYLQIYGLGIIDVRKHFGTSSIVRQARLEIIIHLKKTLDTISNPLLPEKIKEIIFNIPIPKILFPVGYLRNLPLLIETLAIDNIKTGELNELILEAK